jgi:hypothetical protein
VDEYEWAYEMEALQKSVEDECRRELAKAMDAALLTEAEKSMNWYDLLAVVRAWAEQIEALRDRPV